MGATEPLIDVGQLVDPARYGAGGHPHELWTVLRRESPVHWCEPDGYPRFWAVTRHADVKYVSTSPERFSSAGRNILGPRGAPSVEASLAGGGVPAYSRSKTLINTDPPEHGDYRRLALPYFKPAVLRDLETRVREISRALLDNAATELDFVTDFAAWHPLRMLCEILGIPQQDERLLLRLTNEFVGSADPEFRRPEDSPALTEFGVYLTKLVAERRAQPREDLVSVLANATLYDRSLPDLDTLVYLTIVAMAGHETTRNAISGGLLALIENPDQLRLLREHPELSATAADEIVRWTTPVIHFVRTATEDCELAGRSIRAGERLALFYASANRDEEVFDEPFAFRVDRTPNPHLSWGFGEHYCLGANLARLEIRVLLEELVARLEHVELAGSAEWMASTFSCGVKHLPIRWRLET